MNDLLAIIGTFILMAVVVPTVMLVQKVVEHSPPGALVIALLGVSAALYIVNRYAGWVR